MNPNIKHLLKDHAYVNIPLNFEEAYELGVYAVESCKNGNLLAQIQSISVLCALHTKALYGWKKRERGARKHKHRLPPDPSEQIAGFCAAIFKEDIERSESGFLRPKIPYAIDNCGMGGDRIVTANVSTISAFIASAGNIPMAKHGSPANADSGRHGSSDFVRLCGIDTCASKKQIEECLEKHSFGYTEALDTRYKHIHLQTHKIARLPHMNDILGPITNPIDPKILKYRLLGVNHLINPKIIAGAYLILNKKRITNVKHAIFVRGLVGREGIDELSICKEGSCIAELKGERIIEYRLYPKDFGLKAIKASSISPPAGMSKGDFSLKILKGEIQGSPLRMILSNASLLFYLAGESDDLRECYQIAENIFNSGKVYQKVLEIRKAIPLK